MTYIFKYLKTNFEKLMHSVMARGLNVNKIFIFILKWSFFATCHGNGAVDGIGGTVKSSAWREMRNGLHVNTH